MAENKCDVVVIGAGVSGLYAAYLLQKQNLNVKVLEAKDRVGGRTFSKKIPAANGEDVWDLGGQWVATSQPRVLKLIKDLGMEVYRQFNTGKKKLMLSNGKVKTYSGFIPNIGPLELLDLNSMLSKLSKLCDGLNTDDLTDNSNVIDYDSTTAYSFVNSNCKYDVTKNIVESVIRVVFGADLGQMSLLWLLYYANLSGGFLKLLEIDNEGAQELRVKGGAASIATELADRIGNLNVIVNDPVKFVDQTNKTYVKVCTVNGNIYKARRVISAIPPHLINKINFKPELPIEKVKISDLMPVGHLIKIIITYERAFWKENGLSGETMVTTPPCGIGPLTVTFDATTSYDNPALVGFICAEHALYWSKKAWGERKTAVLNQLSQMIGKQCLSPIHYEEMDWNKVPYNGGCPTGNMMPKNLIYLQKSFRTPFNRVYWAGTEIAEAWCGYIEGAIESADRSVQELLADWTNTDVTFAQDPPSPIFNKKISEPQEKSRIEGFVLPFVITTVVGVTSFYVLKNMEYI